MTAVVAGLVARFVCGLPGPAAIVIGNGLALSSTAVVLQVSIYQVTNAFSNFPPYFLLPGRSLGWNKEVMELPN